MNDAQYYELAYRVTKKVTVALLDDKTPRTLVYGVTANRDSFHLYLDELGQLNRVLYDHSGFLIEMETALELEPATCLPSKLVYPHGSDFEFCKLLQTMGEEVAFGQFERVAPQLWSGKRKEELLTVAADAFEAKVDLLVSQLGIDERVLACITAKGHAFFVEAATSAIEIQLEGYLRSVYCKSPNSRWIANIPDAVERVINAELSHYALQYHYEMPPAAKEALTAIAHAAVAKKLDLPLAA